MYTVILYKFILLKIKAVLKDKSQLVIGSKAVIMITYKEKKLKFFSDSSAC